jgi:hypothetical protein
MVAPPSTGASPADGDDSTNQPTFRYPAVLVLMLVTVVFVIAAPDASWSRALVLTIESLTLVVIVATSRERESVRLLRAGAIGLVMIAVVILVAVGAAPRWLGSTAAIFVTTGVPFALARGLLRLLRLEGVTFTAVAGSLAIYLSTGLIFAWLVDFIAQLSSTPYFAQHTDGTLGDKVYFSFTVLTTTGFGDFTPASPAGHALAVIEMLTGQLYLVTVIGLLIGNFAARRGAT